MNLLERVQFLCNRKNLTVARLEQELGFSRGALYKWAVSTPSGDKLKAVANYFGVTTDFLLGNDIYSVCLAPEYDHLTLDGQPLLDAFFEYCREHDASLDDIAAQTKIPLKWLVELQEGTTSALSEYLWSLIFNEYFGIGFYTFLNDRGIYDGDIHPALNGDADRNEAYKRARLEDYHRELSGAGAENPYIPKTLAAHFEGKEFSESQLRKIGAFVDFVAQQGDDDD